MDDPQIPRGSISCCQWILYWALFNEVYVKSINLIRPCGHVEIPEVFLSSISSLLKKTIKIIFCLKTSFSDLEHEFQFTISILKENSEQMAYDSSKKHYHCCWVRAYTMKLVCSSKVLHCKFKIMITGGFKQMGRAWVISIGTVH